MSSSKSKTLLAGDYCHDPHNGIKRPHTILGNYIVDYTKPVANVRCPIWFSAVKPSARPYGTLDQTKMLVRGMD